MIPEIDYIKTYDLHEALELLSSNKVNLKVIAGGTDIIPGFQHNYSRFSKINKLIDINSINELKSIEVKKDNIEVGAGLTFTEIISHKEIFKAFPLLVKAISTIGSVQIRNRATIGGNIINNAPCADSLSPLLVYNASLRILSNSKTKIVFLKDFLIDAYKTRIKRDELLSHIIIPKISKEYTGDFYKLGRRRGVAISRLSLAVLLKFDEQIIENLKIAGGAITPVAMRFTDIEKMGIGEKLSNELLVSLSQEIGRTVLEVTGLRWSSAYKLPVVQQALYQILVNICKKSKSVNAD